MRKDYNPNLNLLLQKMFDDESTLDKILLTDDMHSLYAICLSIQDGYSFEEFSEFFDDLVSICGEEFNVLDKLKEEELENVSGGTSYLNKFTAATLASLSTFMSVPVYGVQDASSGSAVMSVPVAGTEEDDPDSTIDGVPVRKLSAEQEAIPIDKESFGEKIKKGIDKVTNAIWNNKGKILLSICGIVLFGEYLIYNKKTIAEHINNWIATRRAIKDCKKNIDNIQNKLLQNAIKPVDKNGTPTNTADLTDYYREKQTTLEDRLKTQNQRLEDLQKYGKLTHIIHDALPGGACAVFAGLPYALNWCTQTLVDLRKPIASIREIRQLRLDLSADLEAWRKKMEIWLSEQTSDPYDPEEGERLLDKALNELVKGQHVAKQGVMNFFRTIQRGRRNDKLGIEPVKGGYVTIFNGPSGTGKTFTATLMTSCLTNVEPYVVRAIDLKEQKTALTNNYYQPSYATLLMSSRSTNAKGEEKENYYSLANYVQQHPKKGVVIIDEYDKLYDDKSMDKHPLDEFMRVILDDGLMSDGSQRIDASGTVFILTTNETNASLEGRIIVDEYGHKYEEFTDAQGNRTRLEAKTDSSGTQTLIPHDPSLMARLRGRTCTFDALKEEDFVEIAKQYLGDDPGKTLKDVQREGGTMKATLCERLTWGFHDVYIDDKSYKTIAAYASKQANSVRCIVGTGTADNGTVKGDYREALRAKISEMLNKGASVRNAKFVATAKLEQEPQHKTETVKFDVKFVGYED